jgi:S-layer protein
VTNAATGTADVLNLSLTKAGLLQAGSVTAANVETVNITTADTQNTPTNPLDTLTLVATGATTVNISGNAGLNLSGVTNLALTSLDASGISKGDFTFTSGALAGAATIKGSAAGTNTVTFSAAVSGAVTYTGGTGNDIVTGSNGKNNVVNLGEGTNSFTASGAGNNTITGGTGVDTITGGSGNDTIVGGGGADVITAGEGADKITLSGNKSTIIQADGESGANTSTTVQVQELTTGFDIVYGAVAGTIFDLNPLAGGSYTLNLTATNLAGADNVVNFARGNYDAGAGIFSYAANGVDTAVTYDNDLAPQSGGFETVIFVGFVAGSTTSIAAADIITFG